MSAPRIDAPRRKVIKAIPARTYGHPAFWSTLECGHSPFVYSAFNRKDGAPPKRVKCWECHRNRCTGVGVIKAYWLLGPKGKYLSDTPGRFAGWHRGKIFGRLDCKSGKLMKPENRVFFATWDDAIACVYRPCRKCKPAP